MWGRRFETGEVPSAVLTDVGQVGKPDYMHPRGEQDKTGTKGLVAP